MPLADMLADNALSAVVQWLIVGKNDDYIYTRLKDRYQNESRQSIQAVIRRGLQAESAGANYQFLGANQSPNLSTIPVNANRPIRGGQRRHRFQYRATVTYGLGTASERSFTIFRQSDKLLTAGELTERVTDTARNVYQSTGRGDQYSPYLASDTPRVEIISVERTY